MGSRPKQVQKRWILEDTCLKNLTWDPTELGWKTPKGNIQNFHYSSEFGRSILQHKNLEQEGLSNKWIREELDDDFLKQYWKQL